MSSGKCWPICLGINVLIHGGESMVYIPGSIIDFQLFPLWLCSSTIGLYLLYQYKNVSILLHFKAV